MELVAPPSEEPGAIATRAYRVVFWQHQHPKADSWSAYIFDFDGAEDVHEVIEWAESHFDEHTNPAASPRRGYVLYAHVPDETWMLQLAGVDPTVPPEAPDPNANLSRLHPRSRP
jgi:hypothetical protein